MTFSLLWSLMVALPLQVVRVPADEVRFSTCDLFLFFLVEN